MHTHVGLRPEPLGGFRKKFSTYGEKLKFSLNLVLLLIDLFLSSLVLC